MICMENILCLQKNALNFWICDACKRVHLWSYNPKAWFRIYKRKEVLCEKSLDYFKELDEFFVINLNDYCDAIENGLLKDFIEKNPLTDKKYYVEKDLRIVCILDTKLNKIIEEYDLEFEDYNEYDLDIKEEVENFVYTIN